MIVPLNIEFDLDEAKEYYNTLNTRYQDFKWSFNNDVENPEPHKHEGLFGWGIQSNLTDLSQPCPPYNIHKEKNQDYRNTKLVFGFAKKLIDFFPDVRQLGIAVHPPGVEIAQHVDNDEYFKIHIPLFANCNSYFIFEDEYHLMSPGKIYLVETKLRHGTSNQGDTNRVHILFKCPRSKFDDVSKLTGKL